MASMGQLMDFAVQEKLSAVFGSTPKIARVFSVRPVPISPGGSLPPTPSARHRVWEKLMSHQPAGV